MWRISLLGFAIASLTAGLWAGLLRLGWRLPVMQPGLYAAHGPLMVGGFLGTVLGLERAVALGRFWNYAAPALTAAGALALIAGVPGPAGAILITTGSLCLIGNFVVIVKRQFALFTITIAAGAACWFIGNCLWLAGRPIVQMFSWWVGFLVLTIVGERLELSRLARPGLRSRILYILGIGAFVAGLAVDVRVPAAGLRLAGVGMLLMTAWLWRYDLALRTVKHNGLTRYMAVNLLAGYFWLGVAGAAWLWFGNDLTTFHYDLMLHAVFLGFAFSMIFAHAPVIFPAVLQRPLPYRPSFYLHSLILHASLALRICADLVGAYAAYQWGGMLNVAALVLFLATTAFAIRSGAIPGGHRAPGLAV
jgi:hypothetical protein